MHRKTTHEFMKTLAEKYDISTATVNDIVRSPFRFLRYRVMNELDTDAEYYPTFLISGLGKFVITPGRKKYIRTMKEKSRKRKEYTKLETA